jgi:plastocyanin
VYRWWVFVHVAGVVAFMAAHGTSMYVTLRLRRERDPRRVVDLLELSSSTVPLFWWSFGVLLLGGVVAAFVGDRWEAWLWISVAILVATVVAMYALARPFVRKVGLVARALADGSTAVTEEEFVGLLRSGRAEAIAAIGFGGLLAILYLMLFQPGIGGASATPREVVDGAVTVSASDAFSFDVAEIRAPAGEPFEIVFTNDDPGVEHNVSVYADEPIATGELVAGPATTTTRVPALGAGTYGFRCDIHPVMQGELVVEA